MLLFSLNLYSVNCLHLFLFSFIFCDCKNLRHSYTHQSLYSQNQAIRMRNFPSTTCVSVNHVEARTPKELTSPLTSSCAEHTWGSWEHSHFWKWRLRLGSVQANIICIDKSMQNCQNTIDRPTTWPRPLTLKFSLPWYRPYLQILHYSW